MADITCTCCNKSYPEMEGFEGREQAFRCSADITGETVVGNYGSTVLDMRLARFVPVRPPHLSDGILCDECITRMLEEGVLKIELTAGSFQMVDDAKLADLIEMLSADVDLDPKERVAGAV